MLEYRLQLEVYWMKTLLTLYASDLNERTKFINEDKETFPIIPKIW